MPTPTYEEAVAAEDRRAESWGVSWDNFWLGLSNRLPWFRPTRELDPGEYPGNVAQAVGEQIGDALATGAGRAGDAAGRAVQAAGGVVVDAAAKVGQKVEEHKAEIAVTIIATGALAVSGLVLVARILR